MSISGRNNQKRSLARKNNLHNDMDRNEPESSSHGHIRSQRAAAEAPERVMHRRNDPNPHASVRFKLPNQTTIISTLTALKPREETTPLSDEEDDFDKAQSDSSENRSSPHGSRYSTQRAEIRRLQMEVAALKEQHERLLVSESTRLERIRDLKRKSEADASSSKALMTELDRTRASLNRLKEHLQCQICLEMLKSPWTLAPCGHVGCLECLLNWFTTGVDEEDTTDPLYRDKTCPQCRTLIVLVPTPSYILKNLIEEMQSPSPAPQSSPTSATNIVNPWSGIFARVGVQQDSDEEGTYSEGDSYEEDYSDAEWSDSPSESSEYRGEFLARREHLDQVMTWEIEMRNEATEWTEPTWQPPRFDVGIVDLSPEDITRFFLSASEISSLLRRGATQEMIRLFHLSYDHQKGIILHHTEALTIRLGWNLSRSSDDPDGRIYMRAVFDELKDHPERFRIENTRWNEATIVRLVPSRGEPNGSDDGDDS